jgi:antitoxin MazE
MQSHLDVSELQPNGGECFLENDALPTLSELSLEELLAAVTELPEDEVDWGKPMGQESW